MNYDLRFSQIVETLGQNQKAINYLKLEPIPLPSIVDNTLHTFRFCA